MAYVVDSLTLKLESKISYHTEAKLHYMEIKSMADELIKENKKLHDDKMEYLDRMNRLMDRKNEAIKEQMAAMEEQLETADKKLTAAKQELVAAKEELATAKRELVAAKEELTAAKHEHAAANHDNMVTEEELAQKNEELVVLRKKLQKSEAMHTQLQQQIGSAPGPEPVILGRVTRSKYKREMLLQGSLLNDADGNLLKKHKSCPQLPIAVQSASRGDDLEVVGQMLIKGFTETDSGWHVGLKEMGKLNVKPFWDACAMKLPPSQSAARASELYTEWQELISNPEWKPFKTVTVDGNRQDVIDDDDEKLQGLKMAWGESPYNSVIRALVERKEHNCDGTTVDIWNYKEGRKATIGEFSEHILDQLKQFRLKTC
ncbi:unnamed protein product [Alopecurus aequalis]